MLLRLAISFVFSIFLFGQYVFAQKGNLTISPEIGAQVPLAKVSVNGFTKGTLKNNVIWVVPSYGVSLSYQFSYNTSLNLRFLNGQAGYYVGVVHEKPCVNGYNGVYGDRWKGSSFNERRIVLTVEKKLSKANVKKRFATYVSVQAGMGIDFRSRESDSSKIFMPSTNLCGEEYYLDANNFNKQKLGFVLPLQLNLVSAFKGKDRLRLSLFYHIGLTEHYSTHVDYVTPDYTERSTFKIMGTSLGMVLSYPIVILRKKQ